MIGPKEQARRAMREATASGVQPTRVPSPQLRAIVATHEAKPIKKRAKRGTFDRTVYQRDLMRKRRAKKPAGSET